ncbi:hypothetical protein BC940DRAFT_337630 [Gongronella butleri]|nr:hypothetical protein BC940DRAFT_337630 [Gongronella butleri]
MVNIVPLTVAAAAMIAPALAQAPPPDSALSSFAAEMSQLKSSMLANPTLSSAVAAYSTGGEAYLSSLYANPSNSAVVSQLQAIGSSIAANPAISSAAGAKSAGFTVRPIAAGVMVVAAVVGLGMLQLLASIPNEGVAVMFQCQFIL